MFRRLVRSVLFPAAMFFFFNDTATTEIYTLSLHDALPISQCEASEGTIVRSGQASTSRSNICMHSWMFGQAMADFGSLSLGRKLVATRSVAVGVPATGSGGVHSSNARRYVSFASAHRSDMCSARASLNRTTAISP